MNESNRSSAKERILTAVKASLAPLFLLVFSLALLALSALILSYHRSAPGSDVIADCEPDAAAATSPSHEKTITRISFAGDFLLGSDFGESSGGTFNRALASKGAAYFVEKLRGIFSEDDFTVVNCESVFTDSELKERDKNHDIAYWYRGPTANADLFTEGSIEVVSIANNHIYDYGEAGREDTIEALEARDIIWGDDKKPIILEDNGIKIALYMCTMYGSYQASGILEQIAELRTQADFVIVYYHGGTERVYVPDAWRVKASHDFIDAGADLVIGNHPHVIQPIEEYNGKTIVHSLGNFIFGGSRVTDNRSMIYRIDIASLDGEIISVKGTPLPCYEYESGATTWQPYLIPKEDENYAKVLDFLAGKREAPR